MSGLPFAEPATAPAAVPMLPVDGTMTEMSEAAHAVVTPAAMPQTGWTFADALPLLFLLWLAGALVVLARSWCEHGARELLRLLYDSGLARVELDLHRAAAVTAASWRLRSTKLTILLTE